MQRFYLFIYLGCISFLSFFLSFFFFFFFEALLRTTVDGVGNWKRKNK